MSFGSIIRHEWNFTKYHDTKSTSYIAASILLKVKRINEKRERRIVKNGIFGYFFVIFKMEILLLFPFYLRLGLVNDEGNQAIFRDNLIRSILESQNFHSISQGERTRRGKNTKCHRPKEHNGESNYGTRSAFNVQDFRLWVPSSAVLSSNRTVFPQAKRKDFSSRGFYDRLLWLTLSYGTIPTQI